MGGENSHRDCRGYKASHLSDELLLVASSCRISECLGEVVHVYVVLSELSHNIINRPVQHQFRADERTPVCAVVGV